MRLSRFLFNDWETTTSTIETWYYWINIRNLFIFFKVCSHAFLFYFLIIRIHNWRVTLKNHMQLKCADFMQTSSFHRKPNQHSRVNFQLGLHFCMCAMRICMRRGARINKRRETKQPPPSTPICRAKETLRRCVRDLSRGAICIREQIRERGVFEREMPWSGRPSTRSFQLLREGLHTK